MEDIALVNRWIQNYNVKHFYLQVFFDKAYVISFQDILELISNDDNEGRNFSIERDGRLCITCARYIFIYLFLFFKKLCFYWVYEKIQILACKLNISFVAIKLVP